MGRAAQLRDPVRRRGGDERRDRHERQQRQRHEQEAARAAQVPHAPASVADGCAWPVAVAGRVPQSELRAVRIAQ